MNWPFHGLTRCPSENLAKCTSCRGREEPPNPRASLTVEMPARSKHPLGHERCPVLKFSAWFQSTLPFSWFSTLSFSILKITVSISASLEYCKPIHFTLFINQIQTNQRESKKINLYLCHHFLLEMYEST